MTYLILFITIICIIGSALWSPGTIVLLDFIITPHGIINRYEPLFSPILATIAGLFGSELVSRFVFIGTLMTGAYLGVLFSRWIIKRFSFYQYKTILEIFGGIFFIMNPFAYERMMVQPTIMLGIYLLGYAVYFLFFTRRIIIAGIFSGLAFTIMPHASYMIAIIFGLYFLFFVRSWRVFYTIFFASIIAILMNLNWILAPYFGQVNSVSSVSSFSVTNLDAFRTQSLAPLDVWGTNILLYGFWGEKYGSHYVNISFLSSLWYIAGFLLLFLIGFGLYILYKKDRRVAIAVLLVGFASLIFGIGIASSITNGLTTWMIENIPLWRGYREPQKWIGLLMIMEGIGFLIGFGYLLQRWGGDRILRVSLMTSVIFLFLTWSPGPLMGYHGQLRNTIYPVSYEVFRNDTILSFSGRILALPWHSYIGCSWMGRSVVANPIAGLLAPLPVVFGDNIEVGSILYSNSQTDQSRNIENFIQNGDVSLLRKHDFSHIFLMRSCASSSEMEELFHRIEQSGSIVQEKSDDLYIFYKIQY